MLTRPEAPGSTTPRLAASPAPAPASRCGNHKSGVPVAPDTALSIGLAPEASTSAHRGSASEANQDGFADIGKDVAVQSIRSAFRSREASGDRSKQRQSKWIAGGHPVTRPSASSITPKSSLSLSIDHRGESTSRPSGTTTTRIYHFAFSSHPV